MQKRAKRRLPLLPESRERINVCEYELFEGTGDLFAQLKTTISPGNMRDNLTIYRVVRYILINMHAESALRAFSGTKYQTC